MTRKTVLFSVAIIAALAVLTLIAIRRQGPNKTAPETTGIEAPEIGEEAAAGEMLPMDLYFPSTGGWLHVERREVPAKAESAEQIAAVLESLLTGPSDSNRLAPLPDGVGLRKVYLADNRLAYLDFESSESTPPASGSLREMLTVYSLVNTVLLNFDELEGIVLLWNGRQLKTFAGHVATMRPLPANTDLIARDVAATP